MCAFKKCKNTDIAVIYAITRASYEICNTCWDQHGNKSAEEIIATIKGTDVKPIQRRKYD